MQVEQSFSLTEGESSAVLDRLPQAVFVANDERVYLHANPAACTLLGLPLGAILGRKIDDFADTQSGDEDDVPEQWSSFVQNGVSTGRFRLRRSDGSVRHVEFNALAQVRSGVHISFLRDITEQHLAEKSRLESERVAQLALAARRMGQWMWSMRSGRVTWNDMLETIFGLPAASGDRDYEDFLRVVHPEDVGFVRKKLGETALYGLEYELEYRVVRSDGSVRWISDRGQVLLDSQGARVGLLGVCWDATERRQWEAMLRLSEVRFRSLVEQSPFGVQIFRADGRSILVNQAWSDLWGLPASAHIGTDIHQDERFRAAGTMGYIEAAFEGHASEIPVTRYRMETGQFAGAEVWARGFVYPLHDDDGRLREVVLIQQDVRNSKQFELERAQQAEELARSNAELQRFVYVASHDLKEPLRNMRAFSQLLADRSQAKLSADEVEYLHHITEGAKRMSGLIDGLLDYSRASLVRDLVLVPSDLNQLVEQATDNLRVAITQTEAHVTVENTLPTVNCAPLNIVQLFQNLIGNALKYAGCDNPRIVIRHTKVDGHWLIEVSDNGMGIDPAFHDQIFGVFKRLHGREYAGTGIGLAICKAIVEKHRGEIWVESEAGQGATFCFTLPG